MLNEMHLTAQKETIEKIQFNELNILGNELCLFTVSLFPKFYYLPKAKNQTVHHEKFCVKINPIRRWPVVQAQWSFPPISYSPGK